MQATGFSQNFNRYAYCVNNPLGYVDPGGEVFGIDDAIIILAMAYFGGMQANFFTADNPMNPGDWNWKSANTYTGIVSGAVAGASMVGVMPVWLPKLDGMIPRGLFQAGVNVGINGLVNIINGDKFMDNWESAVISGFINGAITGYELAKANGTNYWWGNEVKYGRNQWSFINVQKPVIDVRIRIKYVTQNGEFDCNYACLEAIDEYYGGNRTQAEFADGNPTNGVVLPTQVGKLYYKAGYYTTQMDVNSATIANDIANSVTIGEPVVLIYDTKETITISSGITARAYHSTIVNRVRIYQDGSFKINLMNPINGGKTIIKNKNWDIVRYIFNVWR